MAQGPAREELRIEEGLRLMAELSGRSYEQMRAIIEFLDTEVFHVSIESCVSFLDPMIDSWDIDLKIFSIEIILNPRLAPASLKRFDFVEIAPEALLAIEPGFEQFLKDKSLSGDATEEEIEFLKMLKFKGRRPAPIHYYRKIAKSKGSTSFPAFGATEGIRLIEDVCSAWGHSNALKRRF